MRQLPFTNETFIIYRRPISSVVTLIAEFDIYMKQNINPLSETIFNCNLCIHMNNAGNLDTLSFQDGLDSFGVVILSFGTHKFHHPLDLVLSDENTSIVSEVSHRLILSNHNFIEKTQQFQN